MMTKKNKIRIATGIIVFGIGYLAYRNWSRNKLYGQIMDAIGPGFSAGTDAYDEYWDVNYWKNPPVDGKVYLKVGDSKLNTWANAIYDSASFTNDDETQFYGIMRQVPDGVALSQLADKFQKRHNEDLKEFINYYYDEKEEQQIISKILSDMPPFRITG